MTTITKPDADDAGMRANALFTLEWIGGRMKLTTRALPDCPAQSMWFNPALASVENRDVAMRIGFQEPIRECFALDKDKWPTKGGRVREGLRRR